MMKIALHSVVVLLLLVAGAPARADNVVVFPVTAKKLPRAHKKAPTLFTEFLAQAVRDTGHTATVADASLGETALVLGCDPTAKSCLAMVAQTLEAELLLFANVRRGRKGASTLRVELTRVEPGEDRVTEEIELHETNTMALARELATAARTFLGAAVAEPPAGSESESATPDPAPEPDPVTPEPTPEPPPDPVPLMSTVETGFSMERVAGYTWGLGGVGVATAVAGGVFLGLAAGVSSDVDSAPTETEQDLEDLDALEARGNTYANVGTGLLIGGGALVVGSVILMIIQGNGPADQPALGLWTTPDGAGVAATWALP